MPDICQNGSLEHIINNVGRYALGCNVQEVFYQYFHITFHLLSLPSS